MEEVLVEEVKNENKERERERWGGRHCNYPQQQKFSS